jgi:hypothetical protein
VELKPDRAPSEWVREVYTTVEADPTTVVAWLKADIELEESQGVVWTRIDGVHGGATVGRGSETAISRLGTELHRALERIAELSEQVRMLAEYVETEEGVFMFANGESVQTIRRRKQAGTP